MKAPKRLPKNWGEWFEWIDEAYSKRSKPIEKTEEPKLINLPITMNYTICLNFEVLISHIDSITNGSLVGLKEVTKEDIINNQPYLNLKATPKNLTISGCPVYYQFLDFADRKKLGCYAKCGSLFYDKGHICDKFLNLLSLPKKQSGLQREISSVELKRQELMAKIGEEELINNELKLTYESLNDKMCEEALVKGEEGVRVVEEQIWAVRGASTQLTKSNNKLKLYQQKITRYDTLINNDYHKLEILRTQLELFDSVA